MFIKTIVLIKGIDCIPGFKASLKLAEYKSVSKF